jgi:hypothetical protein
MPTNRQRAIWADDALSTFRNATGCDHADSLGDLLCDLMHWADAHNFDFSSALARAEGHYAEEIAEEPTLIVAAQEALDYLTDHAIDLEAEPEELLADLRIRLADAIAAAQLIVS